MKLSVRQKLWLTLAGILALTVLAGFADYPKGPDIEWKGKLYREVKVHLGLDLQGGSSLVYDADLSQVSGENQERAMQGVRDVLERRINAFGVSEPVIQTSQVGDKWRVNVELPGISDINEAIKQIGETPILQFKEEAGEDSEQQKLIDNLNEQNKKQAEELLIQAQLAETDFAQLAKDKSQDPGTAEKGGDLDFFGKGEMVAAFEDVAFNKAEVNKVYPELVETDYGWHIIKVTEKKDDKVKASHILIQKYSTDQLGPNYKDTELTGKNLKRADVTFDNQTNLPMVSLEFDSEGAKLFSDITTRNVGKTVAIYLDGSPLSTPTVNEAITDGSAVIEGDFTLEEAKLLASRLNAGALPVPISLVNQRSIGPTLGQISIEKSLFAGLLGLLAVAIFMIAYYRLPGVMAVVSLIIYAMIMLAIFKLWPITLTLAGIAGFILSIGMAVDANVLIFERIIDELRSGNSLDNAIDQGFGRAWLAIRDSNLTTLISALVLGWLGTSSIRGFGVTLAIGILISMFTAITVTRTFLKVFKIKNTWFYGVPKITKKEK
ncbi:MAG: protein translocase subunit SecD [Patescibacteria group bacterium]|jgi:preprotein translocase subunit SecD